jgi:hypothetical protein
MPIYPHAQMAVGQLGVSHEQSSNSGGACRRTWLVRRSRSAVDGYRAASRSDVYVHPIRAEIEANNVKAKQLADDKGLKVAPKLATYKRTTGFIELR